MNDEVTKQPEQQELVLDWNVFEEDIKLLAHKIKELNFSFKDIKGIPRGGWIVAVRLSHLLNLPIVEQSNSKKTIYVDDVVDSGKTLERYKKQHLFFVSWILKQDATYQPDIYIRKYPKRIWLKFPWELSAPV